MADLLQANALVERMQADAEFGLVFHAHCQLCCLDLKCPSHVTSGTESLESQPGPETYQDLQLDLDRFAGEASNSAEVQESAVADRASEHDQLS
eukprot:4617120-Amphidinium_carterae.1